MPVPRSASRVAWARRILSFILCVATLSIANDSRLFAQDSPVVTSRYRSGLRFRTVSTPRAEIHFHQGEERLAARLARIIDEVAPIVEQRFGAPRSRVRVVLVDQSDMSNGWATVVPYNLIEIAAVPPPGRSIIGNTDDWLRMVFAHEYTHVVHLEKSRGWLGGLRRLFGRVPAFYPNLFLPDWQIEGLATYEESAVNGDGRIPAGDFRMILDHAARERRFATLDRATGAVIDWPSGHSAYLYGGYFHQHLAERFGPESLSRLADETSRRLPFTGSRAYRKVFDASLGELWREFQAASVERAPGPAGDSRARLTHHGFSVGSPAYGPDGRLFYSVSGPHAFPAIMEWRADAPPRTVASRVLGTRLAAAGDLLVFDQAEFVDAIALQSDLYATRADDGSTRRLTRGARAADPDVSPDGRTIVCTVQETGRRILATLPLATDNVVPSPAPLVAEDDTEFSAPRWSPDGRQVAAERRRLNGPSEIVIVDVSSRTVRSVLSTGEGRTIFPTWTPDGTMLLYSSDRGGRPFALYALELQSGVTRRFAGAGDGAQAPAISPDGRSVVFAGYSADGYDLYSLPFDPAGWPEVPSDRLMESHARRSDVQRPALDAAIGSRRYSPISTIAPRFWLPYVERDGDDSIIGAGTGGFDALGRHAYTATVGWAVERSRADVQVDYSYNRWRPAFFTSVSDDTDALRDGSIRTREIGGGMLYPWRRVRWASSALAAATMSKDDFDGLQNRPSRRRDAIRLGWSFSTAKRFAYSISTEEGVSLGIVSELASTSTNGTGGSARSFVGEFRGYVPLTPRHAVAAVRLATAASRGNDRAVRDFGAGGGGPQGGSFDLGLDAIGLIRGFDDGDVFGRSAAVVNAEFRFPLGWPQRGIGTFPFLLRAVHGSIFFDAGHAWDHAFRLADVRRAAGGEVSFDTVLGGWIPVTFAAGFAVRHDPSDVRRGTAAFFRLGHAF